MNEQNRSGDFDLPAGEAALLSALGGRVRDLREAKKMPRRVLSDLSGVSPRYLAQLEGGQGNISVGLLLRVATALDVPLWSLFSEASDPSASDMLNLFQRAGPEARADVLGRLQEDVAGAQGRANRVCLVGLRGAGKSTLGRRAGEALGVPFVELNSDIELQAGMPVGEIMALYGADGYRRLEAEAVRRVAARHDRLILAASGGIVSEPETYAELLAKFHTIWVKASPEEHMGRVRAQGDMRPMEGRAEAMQQLQNLLDARRADYARAGAALDTTGATPEVSLGALVSLIHTRGYLD